MSTVRVMTYNIRLGGRARAALRDVVRCVAPAVLLVNESPKTPGTWRRRSRQLAQDWELRYACGGRVAGSNLILVAPHVVVESVVCRVLPTPRLQPRRGVAAAQLVVDGRPVGVVSAHLSLDPGRRLVEVGQVLAQAQALRGPVVVAGDLNEPAGSPCWAVLERAGFVDHGSARSLTFPAAHPDRRIDALLVRGDLEVTRHGHLDVSFDRLAAASDHLPVVADLVL